MPIENPDMRNAVSFLRARWGVVVSLAFICVHTVLLVYDRHKFLRTTIECLDKYGGKFTIVSIILPVLHEAYKKWKANGISHAKAHLREWLFSLCKGVTIIWLFSWGVIFAVSYFTLSLEKFSPEEISAYSQKTVVRVIDSDTGKGSTGFWVDRHGLLVSVGKQRGYWQTVDVESVLDAFPGNHIEIQGGYRKVSGLVNFSDSDTGINIIHVADNPFERKIHMSAAIKFEKNKNRNEAASESYDVANLSEKRPTSGSQIFLRTIESNEGIPEFQMKRGAIVRIGLTTNSQKGVRIYTDIQFKPSYVGAPVFDTGKFVIGIVSEEPSENVILIPSEYVVKALQPFYRR